ncbi:hypothetical protein KCU62_g9054, partial [Aureobasidium sp. EXF-3399]
MRFAGFSAISLLLASSSAIPTKRQALIDSIGGSSLDDILAEIKDNGNISLLGDLLEVAVDTLSTEASAVAECYNPTASSAPGAGASESGSGSGSLGSGSSGLGAGAGAGVGAGVGADSELSSLLSSIASAATAAPDAANNAAQEAAAAASSALNFLSTANPAASVAPQISSLLSSIAGNTAAIPTAEASNIASSLADAASAVPSQLSSILGSIASDASSVPTAVGQDAAAAASSALGFLSTANPAASVAPAISSLLSSIAANPSASIPANVASSLTDAASSVIGNLPGVSAGAGVGVGGGNGNPAFSSLVSSLGNDPAVTGAPALSSAIASLTNPAVSIGSSLASDLSSVLANPSSTLPSGVVSSLVSQISSAVNNGQNTVSPVTNSRGSSSSVASASSTPIVCPFASKSTYSALGSQFTRYCNEFYGGDVLNLGNSVLKRQAIGSLNGCANICSPNARCLGTLYDPKTGSCTFYSSLTNGVTRNGIQFALRSSAASSILPPVSISATAGASIGVSASVPTGNNAGPTSSRVSLPGFSSVPSGIVSSLVSEASTATGVIGSQLSSLISQLTTASSVNTGALSSLISELPTATSLPSGLISSVVNAGSTSLRPSLPGFSSVPIISGITSAVGSVTSEIGASATSAISSALSDASSIINSLTSGVTDPSSISSIISSVQSEATATVSSILSEESSAIASITSNIPSITSAVGSITSDVGSITSGVGSITLPPGVTVPTGVTLTSTTTSCGGALVDLCATLGIGNGVTVNLGIGGNSGATPTTFSGASGQFTATSTQCNGVVCLALGVGPSVTATLGALNPDGSIIEIGAGLGSTPTVTGVPSVPGVTATTTSCNGLLCLALGVGPSATVTLGALNSDGSLINIGAGVSGVSTPAITAPSVPTTLPGGAVITTTTASCNSVLCLALGVGPSTTVTLGALNTDGSIVSVSAGLPVSTPAITSVTVVPTSTVVDGTSITAISQSCTGSGLLQACINLGLGPLGTVTLGANVLPTDGGLVSAGVSATLPVASAAITVPAVLATPLTISGNTITAVSTSCSGAAIDACITLGLGDIATVTLGAGVLPSDGGLVSAGVSATLPVASAAITVPAVLATPLTISGNTITAVSTSCSGAAVDACITLGLGNLATITLDAGVLPTSGGLATVSGGASITAPAVIPTSTVINGNTITAISSSCSGALLDACLTVGLGNLGAVTLNAGVLPSSGGIATVSAGAGVSGVASLSASVSAGVTPAPTAVAAVSIITTTSRSTSCSGGLLGVPLLCATVNVPGLVTVSVVARDQPTTLATLVRK